jgi:cysteine desulfurase
MGLGCKLQENPTWIKQTMAKTSTYLDYNAAAPLLNEARAAIIDALDVNANPSSVHASGRAAKAIVAKARRQVAALVGAAPDHVIFTSGATEAAQMLLTPHYSMGRSPLKVSHLYVCAADHPCTLAGGQFDKERISLIPVLASGVMDIDALKEMLNAHDKSGGLPLVVCHAANNETGVIQPFAEIGKIIKSAGGMFVLDAVQAVGRIKFDITETCADYLILSSHKIGGPKGAGAVVAASDLVMPLPLIRGGGQERGHRGGTEAVMNIAGFGAAAEAAQFSSDRFNTLADRQNHLETGLRRILPDIVIHGQDENKVADRLPNTSFFTVPNAKAETLQINFDLAGFAVSAGSACSSGKVGRSHVLTAMGVEGEEGAIRVSFGLQTTKNEIDAFLEAFAQIMARMKR